jgi:hypothetical protein
MGTGSESMSAGAEMMVLEPSQAHLFQVVLGSIIVAGVLLLGFGVWSVGSFGTFTDGVAFLQGVRLRAREPHFVFSEPLPVGKPQVATFEIANLSDSPVNLLGARVGCSCTKAGVFPVTIPPRSARPVEFRYTPAANDGGGEVEQKIEIFSDQSSDSLSLGIYASVLPVHPVKLP